MAQIALDCPHCRTAKAAFSGNTLQPAPPGQQTMFIMLFQCQVCGKGIVAKLPSPNSQVIHAWMQGQISMQTTSGVITVVRHWPTSIETKAPDHSPNNVKSF